MAKKKSAAVPKVDPAERRRAGRIYKTLDELYPDAHCALKHRSAWQLLVATILSAQCTDVRVNMVTPALFKKYPNPRTMGKAKPSDLENMIKSTGFFRNKAKSIKGAAVAIVDEFGGKVPDTMDELLSLPGVARKTANVVLGNAFDKNVGVVVDTHVTRLGRRLGFTEEKDPQKIEPDLMARFPRKNWAVLAHLLIWHGREVCKAQRPRCNECRLNGSCPKIGVEDR